MKELTHYTFDWEEFHRRRPDPAAAARIEAEQEAEKARQRALGEAERLGVRRLEDLGPLARRLSAEGWDRAAVEFKVLNAARLVGLVWFHGFVPCQREIERALEAKR